MQATLQATLTLSVLHHASHPDPVCVVACRCISLLISTQAKREIAKALRVFVDSDNYPVLVHCIHGKDRTGLIVMIIMLLCSVEPAVCPRTRPCYLMMLPEGSDAFVVLNSTMYSGIW